MAAAALAYKCLEVAYMRVVYWKHSSINRDRHELQATLQIASQGTAINLQFNCVQTQLSFRVLCLGVH